MSKKPSFFRGEELPRLLVLLVLLLFGMAYFWHAIYDRDLPAAEPEALVDARPVPVVADKSPEFETVTDKTPISFRDMAAYARLIKRAEETSAADLAVEARRDVYFTHLWDRPELYRGVPVHLLGRALRVSRYESKKSRTGWLYEAWVGTDESQNYPYVCIFEDLPKGFPVGPNIGERVVFNGYFLKLMRYQAGHDVVRAAPVLVGRIGWTPGPRAAKGADGGMRPLHWMALAVGVMFVISLFRWLSGLRRTLAPRSSALRERPLEDIDPEALARWVESVPAEDESEPEEPSR